jgi:DHA1 family multidrug resistance protein-like MFS transporter
VSLGRRNFVVVWASTFVTAAGMAAFLPLIPLYLGDLGVQDEGAVRLWSGVLVAAAPLPAAFMGPVWGALGDRLGRKLMMVRANLAIVLFVGLMAWARSPWQMLGLRLGQGVFSGFLAPAMTLVSVSASDERQGRTAANLQMAPLAGAGVGYLVGGQVGDVLGYRAVFQMTAALSLLAVVLVAMLAREPEQHRAPAEPLHPLQLVQSLFREVVGLLQRPELRLALLAAFAVRFSVSLVDPVLALYVEGLRGFDPSRLGTATGLVFGAEAVATLLFTPLWGRFGDRRGPRRTALVCAAGASVFLLGQALVHHVAPLVLLRLGSGAFAAGVVPAAFAMASRHSSRTSRGGAYGVTFSSVVLGRALAPVCGGVLAALVGLRPLFVLAAVLLAGAAWAQRAGRGGGAASAGDGPSAAPPTRR